MIKLEDFLMQMQKTCYTCGYSSLSMVCDFLGTKIEEEEFEKELPYGYFGITPFKVNKLFNSHMPNYKAKWRFISEKKLARIVEKQLKDNLPVPFLCLAKNKFGTPILVGHFSVIFGMDKENSMFYIADPFIGCEKEMTYEELFNELSFREASKNNTLFVYRVLKRIVRLRGYIILIIERK